MPHLLTILLFGLEMSMKAIKFKPLLWKKDQRVLKPQRLRISTLLEWFKSKISFKFILCSADIDLKDVFVPDHNRLEKALDFASGANNILKHSRI